jgi:hypothetical protein
MKIPFHQNSVSALLPSFLLAASIVACPAAGVVVPEVVAAFAANPGDEFSPTYQIAGMSVSSLRTDGSQTTLEAGVAVQGSVFLLVEQGASLPTAKANNQYFEFALTPAAGNRVTLTEMSFDAARGGASSPRGWGVYSNIDGFSQLFGTAEIPTVQPSFSSFSVDLSALPEFDEELILRIYAYGPEVPGNGIFFDNIVVVGSLIPEPGSAMLAAGGLVLALRRRRQASR